jgi:hypothetical protein
MNRETKTIKTPTGHEVVLNAYVTGRERRALTNVYLSGGLDFNFDSKNVKGLDATLIDKAQNLAWNTVVVSFNGKKDGDVFEGKAFSIVDAILDLPDVDTQFIIKAVNEITSDKDFEQKKTQ